MNRAESAFADVLVYLIDVRLAQFASITKTPVKQIHLFHYWPSGAMGISGIRSVHFSPQSDKKLCPTNLSSKKFYISSKLKYFNEALYDFSVIFDQIWSLLITCSLDFFFYFHP